MLNVSNDHNLHQIQHFQRQSKVFILTRSHASWCEMENDVNVTSITLLTKQWRLRESGAICTPLTAGNFLKYLASSERQYSLFYSKWKVGFFWWFFLHLLCDSVCQLCSFTFLSTKTTKKNSCQFFLQVGHPAKVVLLWTCLLNSVQYQRMFLNSMQIWKFIACFQQCKLNATISWVYNKWAYSIGRHPSSVWRRRSAYSNDMKPILTRFHI